MLCYCYWRSSENPEPNGDSRSDEAPGPEAIHDTLEEGEKGSNTKSKSGDCCSMKDDPPLESGSNMASQEDEDEDIEDKIPLRAARFSPNGELVIENAAIAARKNAAELNRRRRALREAQAG